MVERLAGGAQAEYKQKTGKDTLIKIDSDNYLPANGCVILNPCPKLF
jgi:hypothetical protein